MKKVSLINLKPDKKGTVIEIMGGMGIKDRMMSMGIYIGREVAKLSHIGLRGPVVIKVGRSILALGHGMAMKIFVETE